MATPSVVARVHTGPDAGRDEIDPLTTKAVDVTDVQIELKGLKACRTLIAADLWWASRSGFTHFEMP